MQTFLLGIIAVLVLALIAVLILNWRQKRLSRPVAAPASDIEYRGRLARAVTTWALAAIATLGAVIVSFAGYNAFITSAGQGVDAVTRKEAVDQFFRVAQYVLGSLLPVVAAL
jgi:amino acid transporter